jgi:GH15 family glucan-1,4-alpha-glucosidase
LGPDGPPVHGRCPRPGHTGTADAILADVLGETAPSGSLAERTAADGSHRLASPLGWSSAMFLLALDERYGSA